MINGVKKIALVLSGSLSCSLLSRLCLSAKSAAGVPVVGFVSASAQDQVLNELSAAATTELNLQDGKAPDWITLIPPGVFSLVDGRGPFRNFDPDAVISASLARAGKTELPGDYDHHMDVPASAGVKGLASGWIKELKTEGGAVRAKVQWTAAGRKHIEDGEYRYVSPRFGTDKDGNVVCIVRFALTNKPAITDLPAIAAATTQHPDKETDVNLLQRICGALAISASVTEDQAVELVRVLFEKFNGVTQAAGLTSAAAADQVIAALRKPDATLFVSAADHKVVVDELAVLKKTTADAKTAQLAATISAAVEDGIAKGQIVPAAKQDWIDLCTSAASTDPVTKFLKTAPIVLPGIQGGQRGPAPAGGEISAAAVEADPELMDLCRQAGVTPEAFAKTRNAENKAREERARNAQR